MTSIALDPPAKERTRGGAPARNAILRWAFRMFRRDWRRQALIIALLAAAVAATTVGLGVITNVAELHADPTFGNANTILHLHGADPHLDADISALGEHFGAIDVVQHQRVSVPGSISTMDLRAADPNGSFVAPTIRLDAGRLPVRAGEVAVTDAVAKTFDLHRNATWTVNGENYAVVGTVENPLDLTDQFALAAAGTLAHPTDIAVLTSGSANDNFRPATGTPMSIEGRATAGKATIEGTILALSTIGMLFVGLLAVAAFAVVAQRRMRALGVLSSVGANDRSVRLVMLANGAAVGFSSAVVGGIVGLLVWLSVFRWVQSTVGHRISPLDLPWFAVTVGLALAVATSIVAAWWPARAAAKVPIVAALSGRPPKRQPARRFAVAGVITLAAGYSFLALGERHRAGFIVGGVLASAIGLLLLAPLAIQAVAFLAARAPIAPRLALRDLARYQSRSGAALGAATLAIAIAATIAISAAAAHPTTVQGNLPADELVVYIGQKPMGPGFPLPVLSADQQRAADSTAQQVAASLHAKALELMAVYNPNAPVEAAGQGPGEQLGGRPTVSLAEVTPGPNGGESINRFAGMYVATPELLRAFGIESTEIPTGADIITARKDLASMTVFDPASRDGSTKPASRAIVNNVPQHDSEPTALVTERGMRTLGLAAAPGGWLLRAPSTLTRSQITSAQRAAANVGLVVEARSAPTDLAPLRNWSTAAGILVALGVLAMTVGLIRSESGRDLSTLTATGASSRTRRAITGATTGALAVLGALLGTAGAYAALIAWHRSDLHPLTEVPWTNLVLILVALPALATAVGWLLAGREPATANRQPIE